MFVKKASDGTDDQMRPEPLQRDSSESLIGPYRCLTDEEHKQIEAAWTKQNGGWYGNSRTRPNGLAPLEFGVRKRRR